jgi:hypothetical protein
MMLAHHHDDGALIGNAFSSRDHDDARVFAAFSGPCGVPLRRQAHRGAQAPERAVAEDHVAAVGAGDVAGDRQAEP